MKNSSSKYRALLTLLVNKVRTTNTVWLTSIPALIVVVVMMILGTVNFSKMNSMLIVSCLFAIGGISSLVVVIRKEFPFFRNIRGKTAIALGIVGLLMAWSISLAIVIRVALELFGM
jgi:hypothetical protein